MARVTSPIPARACRVALALCVAATCASASAQQRIEVPREDGHVTALMVYPAGGHAAGCAPLAVISHGAGGSEFGYRYLAQALANAGYTTVVMGHRESGLAPLQASIRAKGMAQGIWALVTDSKAEGARLLDIGATLRWVDNECKAPFRVLLGHSMGAETVMLEAGTPNTIHLASPPAGQRRFNAYVALSPEGPGVIFPDLAWSSVGVPMLVMSGTLDQSLHGGPMARLIPWSEMPGAAGTCQWEGVIEGATHFNFAGDGPDAGRVTPIVTATVLSFLRGVRNGTCSAPQPIPGLKLQRK